MKALVIGKSNYNILCEDNGYPEEGSNHIFSNVTESISGLAPVAAYLLGKYGFESYIASTIGDDTYGTYIKKFLDKYNIHTEYMETSYDKKTNVSFSIFNQSSKKLTVNSIAKEKVFLKKNDFAVVPDIFLTDGYDYSASISMFNKYNKINSVLLTSESNHEMFELSKYAKYIIATKEFTEYVSGIKMNFASPQTLADAYMALIKKYPGKVVVVTLKEKGVIYLKDNQIKVMPSLKFDYKDLSNAYEVFAAGFALGVAYNYDLEKSITFGTICSSVASKEKGVDAFDDLSEINSYFNQKYPNNQNENNNQSNAQA